MTKRLQRPLLLLVAGCLICASGCAPTASALQKFQTGDIGALSASEWQALASLGSSVGVPIPSLTPQEADAVVNFLNANNIESIDDLERLLRSGNVTVPQELVDLFNASGLAT